MDERTLKVLEELTKDIDTIVFKSPATRGRMGAKFDLRSRGPLIEEVLENNPEAKFDLFDCNSIGYIDEDTTYAECLVGVELDSDGLSDIGTLYEYPNLKRLVLNIVSEPNESDIGSLQTALFDFPHLTEVVINRSGVSDAMSELLESVIHFPGEEREVRFGSKTRRKMWKKKTKSKATV